MENQSGKDMMNDKNGLSEFEASLLQNDEEVLERENDVEMMEPDDITVETDDFGQKKKVRLTRNEKAIQLVLGDIKRATKFSEIQVKCMIKPVVERVEILTSTVDKREEEIRMMASENEELKEMLSVFQDEGAKKPAANGNEEIRNAPKDGQAVDGDQESRKKEELITVLREAELNEVGVLTQFLMEKFDLEIQVGREREALEILSIEEQKAQKESREKAEENRFMSNELQATRKTVRQLEKKTLMLQQELLKKNKQVDALKAKLQDLEGDKEFVQREIAANSYSQKSKERRTAADPNYQTFQPTDAEFTLQTSRSMTRPPICKGKDREDHRGIETVRTYYEETEEILEDEYDSEESDRGVPTRRQSYNAHNANTTHINETATVAQLLFQQAIPDPEKFSGAEKTISMKSFNLAFKLKFSHMTEDQQIVLLETKFLKGKALLAFKGLSEREKESVDSIMNALAVRLRVSSEDMTRMAKMKWEKLSIKEDQSLEDFCLEIDEKAAAAYRRVCKVELSSIKVTKLLEALSSRDRMMKCVIDSTLLKIPEVEHYEEARKLAVHNEMGSENHEKSQGSTKNKVNPDERKSGTKSNGPTQDTNENGYSSGAPARTQNNRLRNSAPTRQMQNNSEKPADGNMNWRQSTAMQQTAGNSNNTTTGNAQNSWNINTQRCTACNEVGCHSPTCPRAPRSHASRSFANNVTCYKCGGLGHFASSCVQTTEKTKEDTQTTPSNSVATLERETNAPEEGRPYVNEAEKPKTIPTLKIDTYVDSAEERSKVRVERCRMGRATVDIVIDSGACISMMSKHTWDDIVKVNGEKWEKEVKIETSDMEAVYAANSQPIRLLFKVTVETAMQSRTREISYYVADVERDTIILGINQFGKMGIQVSMEEKPRDIKLVRNEKINPGRSKIVQVLVEGVIKDEESHCLVSPLVNCLPPAVCQVNKNGEAFVKLVNSTTEVIVFEKGHTIAQGELENFEVVQEKAERLKIIGEVFENVEANPVNTDNFVDVVEDKLGKEEHWNQVCQQLKKKPDMSSGEEEVWKVIKDFQHLFAIDDMELGRTNVVECDIEVMEGVQPIRQRPRPIPMAVRPEIRKMLEKMVLQGVIRESKSPWSSPVVLVKKKDGSVRMCIDYRKVNKVIKNNAHPLPHIEATLQSLAGKKFFTTLDMLAGYWQVPVQENCKQVTAFAVGSELYEWNVLPFGLTTSPAIFQAAMETIVGDSLGSSAFVYVDDLLIASATLEEHAKDVALILQKIEKSGMKLKASKCHIAQMEVEYLGHKITPDGVSTEKTKVEKMEKYSRPTNAKELHSFLGLIGYYRKFVINFAMLAAHLTPLTSKKVEWKWGEEQETAFQKLKEAICSAPVLMQPNVEAAVDGSKPFYIYTDASRLGVGAVLSQESDDKEQHPIAFASKALSKAETRYHITDLEALAMMFALKRFKTIVYGTKVIVCTDHKPLMYILNGAPLADRLLRWSLDLLEYDVRIVYIAGQANKVADALSRGGCATVEMEEPETVEMSKIVGEIRENELATKDLLDTKLWYQWLKEEDGWKEVITRLESGEIEGKIKIPGVKGEVLLENYALIGKSLRNTEDENCNRMVVPQLAINKVISEAHEGALAGHFGTEKVFRQLRKIFFWPKMRVSIENFVKACAKCVCTNDYPKMTAPLTPYKTSAPLEIVALDLIDMGLSTQGNRYILTIIDLFTKYGIGVPIPDKKGETVLRAFVERWAIGEGRIPNKLLTDMGKEFVNQQFKQFTDMLKIEHITTKGYDSRANGAVERFNKTLVHTMKKKMAVPYEWDDQIPFAVYAYNSVPHRTTGESPMYLFQGRDPRGPLEMSGEDAVGMSYADVDEYKNLMSQELLKAHKIAKEHADQECETYKRLFDAKHHTSDKTYPVPGSRVLVEIPAEKLGARCPKLINKWKGPYRVVSCSNNSAKIVPAWGRSTETLLIPFDKLRLIPSQMGNDPIVTNKGRRACVKGNEGGEFSLDGLSEQVTYNNDFVFRDLYTCKCPTPCRFFIPDTPKFKPGCFTTSPTQFNRMHVILGLNPDMRSDPDALQLLAMSPLPLKEKPPTDAVWRAMSHCATLKLVAEDVPGWGISYQNLYGRLVNSCLSAKLMQKETVVIQLCPGVKSSQVPLSNTTIRKWDDDKEGEDTSMDSCSLALVVVPFRTDEHEVEEWQAEVDQWPSDVKNLVLVTAPGAIKDFAKVPVVAQQMKEVKRKSGNLIRITPDELVPSQQNKSLALVGDTRSYETYWKTVKAMLETLGIPWTSFELEKEKRAADTEKDRKSESSTSDKGGQGSHHSVAKKRRFH